MGFLDTVIKDSGNEFASKVSEGIAAGDITSYIDTGSYIFNALVSGSIYGGLPSNKVTALAGESSTGKTFFALSVVRNFLELNPTGGVIYFESESAISKSMIEERGIDSNRMIMMPVSTIEEFRTQASRILDKYLKEPKDQRVPRVFVLDFRVLTLKLGQANVPMLVTNHTYDVIGSYVPTKEMGGGTGLKYAASSIIYLTKSKERDSKKEVVGNIIKCEAKKSRLTVEGSKIATRLFFDERGLDKYYGLLELGIDHGIFGKNGNRVLIGKSSVYPSAVLADPEKYFTEDIMHQLELAAETEFKYGKVGIDEVDDTQERELQDS